MAGFCLTSVCVCVCVFSLQAIIQRPNPVYSLSLTWGALFEDLARDKFKETFIKNAKFKIMYVDICNKQNI